MADVVKAFGFLKKCPKRGAAIDSLDPAQIGECGILKPDFRNQHCEFEKEIDLAFPEPLAKELQLTTFVDSNRARGDKTGKSITGLT